MRVQVEIVVEEVDFEENFVVEDDFPETLEVQIEDQNIVEVDSWRLELEKGNYVVVKNQLVVADLVQDVVDEAFGNRCDLSYVKASHEEVV